MIKSEEDKHFYRFCPMMLNWKMVRKEVSSIMSIVTEEKVPSFRFACLDLVDNQIMRNLILLQY